MEYNLPEYYMENKFRGNAIIINVEKFDNGWAKRKGSSEDVERLTKALEALKFKVTPLVDKTAKEIEDTLDEGKKSEVHLNFDFINKKSNSC